MKIIRPVFALLLIVTILLGSTSCLVFYPRTDNGGHRGWYKNRNNPHNPNTTNPGHSEDQGSPGNSGKHRGRGNK